ncbi:MAG TPA: hypothetical protein PK082_02445, partial [Phycisphaerae bacterium]|nr:hypothetical protein [Phycisphaerae bacterium]
MFDRIAQNRQLVAAGKALSPGGAVQVSGVWGSAGALVAAALGRIARRPVLLLTVHLDEADDAADDIEVLTGAPATLFPAWEVDIGTEHVNDEIAGERLRICNLLAGGAGSRENGDPSPGVLV